MTTIIHALAQTTFRHKLEEFGGAIVGFVLGGLVGQEGLIVSMGALGLLVVFDAITGILASHYEGLPIASRKFRRSADKISGYMIMAAAVLIVFSLIDPLKSLGPMATSIVIWWYLAGEVLSVCENLDRMGKPLPGWIVRRILGVKKAMEDDPEPNVYPIDASKKDE